MTFRSKSSTKPHPQTPNPISQATLQVEQSCGLRKCVGDSILAALDLHSLFVLILLIVKKLLGLTCAWSKNNNWKTHEQNETQYIRRVRLLIF